MYKKYVALRDSKGVTDYKVSKETGITKSTFTDWKNGRSIPKPPKLQKIADYLGVSLSYLMTGIEETLPENPKLNERDKRDIAKDLDRIMEEIANDADGPLFYNDQPIPKNKIDLLRNAIEVALEDAKIKNKETYRPYKHKPRPEKD